MTRRDTSTRRMGITVAQKFRGTYPKWIVALIVFYSLLVSTLISFFSLVVRHDTTLTSRESWKQMHSTLEYYANVVEHPCSTVSTLSDERSRKIGLDESTYPSVSGSTLNNSTLNVGGDPVERTKERQSPSEGTDKKKALMEEDLPKVPFTSPPLMSCTASASDIWDRSKEPASLSIESLMSTRSPIVMYLPRFGLGNALRGFCSAFVYALISGSKLVRFHGGPHQQVLDLLCRGFHCGFDHVLPDGKQFTSPNSTYSLLKGIHPVFLPSTESKANFEAIRVPNKSIPNSGRARISSSPNIPFVVISDANVIVSFSGAFYDKFWRKDSSIESCVYSALDVSSVWDVHRIALQQLLARGPTPELMKSVDRNLRMAPWSPCSGGVDESRDDSAKKWPSSRTIHVPRSGFDFGVHVRTRVRSVERPDSKHTSTNGTKDEVISMYTDEVLWRCIRSFIANASTHQTNRLQHARVHLAHEARSTPVINTEEHRKLRGKNNDPTRQIGSGVDGSVGVTRMGVQSGALNLIEHTSTLTTRLAILIVTDNEGLRPMFVELLRPMGDVYFSRSHVTHSSKSRTHGKSLASLDSIADFFLLSRAKTVISFGPTRSSFALMASTLGNSTYVIMDKANCSMCNIHIVHPETAQTTYSHEKNLQV